MDDYYEQKYKFLLGKVYHYEPDEEIRWLRGAGDGMSGGVSDNVLNACLKIYEPTQQDIECVRRGRLEVGMGGNDTLLVFTLKIEGLGQWGFFEPCREEEPNMPKRPMNVTYIKKHGEGYPLDLILVDTSTGRVKAQRVERLDWKFSNRIKELADECLKTRFETKKYNEACAKLSAYPIEYVDSLLTDRWRSPIE